MAMMFLALGKLSFFALELNSFQVNNVTLVNYRLHV